MKIGSERTEYDYSMLRGRIREKVGSEQALYQLIGISNSSLSFYLNNKKEMPQSVMDAIAKVCDIGLDEYGFYFFTPLVHK